jgi:hypothetical protein
MLRASHRKRPRRSALAPSVFAGLHHIRVSVANFPQKIAWARDHNYAAIRRPFHAVCAKMQRAFKILPDDYVLTQGNYTKLLTKV